MSENEEIVGSGVKRKRDYQKLRRNSGEGYMSHKGNAVDRKKPPENVTCKCRGNACHVISLQHRINLWKLFWDMKDYDKQQAFLRTLIQSCLIKRRRPTDNQISRRTTFRYHLPMSYTNTSKVSVCQKTLLDTFQITQKRLRILGEKITAGELDIVDNRGGIRNILERRRWVDKIKAHISSFPTETGHYNRSDSPDALYLSSSLNFTIMHNLFKDVHRNTVTGKDPPVSITWYTDVFKKYFSKLRFGHPRTDTCETCDEYHMMSVNAKTIQEKNSAQLALQEHHDLVKTSKLLLKRYTKCAAYHVLSFDLQMQYSVPALTHSRMYYSRQLSCYNLGIHDETCSKGVMNIWTENVGSRGSTEIASCLYLYLTEELQTPFRKLVLWSDNCNGQNKNQFLIAMYFTLIAKGYFDEIEHRFLVKGHTYMSCDRDFALIEKKTKKVKLITMMDVAQLMGQAAVTNPFTIRMMNGFLAWKDIASGAFITNNKLQISKVTQLRCTKHDFGFVFTSSIYDENPVWKRKKIVKKNFNMAHFKNLELEKRATSKGLAKEKKEDIRQMFPFLTTEEKEYFETVLSS